MNSYKRIGNTFNNCQQCSLHIHLIAQQTNLRVTIYTFFEEIYDVLGQLSNQTIRSAYHDASHHCTRNNPTVPWMGAHNRRYNSLRRRSDQRKSRMPQSEQASVQHNKKMMLAKQAN